MAFDLINTYFPAANELTDTQLQSMRDRLATYGAVRFPNLDMRPDSVFGNYILDPLAFMLAATEEAMRRQRSDLDTEQVAGGVVYDCFRRDTQFVTSTGVKSFNDFKDGESAIVLTHLGNWKRATIHSHGRQTLVPIHIRRAKLHYEVWATRTHNWILRDGSRTRDLKPGQILLEAPFIFKPADYWESTPPERQMWAYGYVFGDGTIMRDSQRRPKWSHVALYGKEKNYLERFLELGFGHSFPPSMHGDPMVYTGSYIKETPALAELPWEHLRAFVRGYLNADGSKNYHTPTSKKKNSNKEFTSIQATGNKYISFIREAFPVVGQFIAYERNLSDQFTNFGKRGAASGEPTVQFGLNNYLHDHAGKFVVTGIDDARGVVEEVWCMDVEDDHSFVFPFGLSTGNCSFVEAFLKNWAVQDRTIKQASGTIRLVCSSDALVELDRGTRFSFATDTTASVFMARLAHPGLLQLLPVGSEVQPGQNQLVFQQISATLYVVDIPVLGQMAAVGVAQGLAATLDRTITNLISAAALYDFYQGAPTLTLPQMAQQARQTAYAVGLGSRGQSVQMIRQNFPETLGCSAVMSDDEESMRGGMNALGIKRGALDLFVKSGTYQFKDTAYLKAPWVIEQNGDTVGRFIVKLDLLHTPVRITGVTHSSGVNLTYEIIGQAKDPARASLLTAGFSELEDLWLVVEMPSQDGSDLIPLIVNADGTSHAVFQVEYWTDPLIANASRFVDGDEIVAENCDLVVRGFLPLVFSRFDVQYVRAAGVLMTLEQARHDIAAYLNSIVYPDGFSLAEVSEIMKYCGAKQITDIRVRAELGFTVATRYLVDSAPSPEDDWTTAVDTDHSFIPYRITVGDIRALSPAYRDANVGTSDEQLCAVGPRNSGLWVEPTIIAFTEVGARA